MIAQVFSSKLVTKENPNGKGYVDLDTPEGIALFGENRADEYIREQKIHNQIIETARTDAIEKLQQSGDL
jgi:adenylate cyclase